MGSRPYRVQGKAIFKGKLLGGRFDIFYFFLLGEGEGGVRGARRGAGSVFIENPTRGWGGFQEEEGPGGCLRRIGDFFWGGGAKYFFSGPKRPPRLYLRGKFPSERRKPTNYFSEAPPP